MLSLPASRHALSQVTDDSFGLGISFPECVCHFSSLWWMHFKELKGCLTGAEASILGWELLTSRRALFFLIERRVSERDACYLLHSNISMLPGDLGWHGALWNPIIVTCGGLQKWPQCPLSIHFLAMWPGGASHQAGKTFSHGIERIGILKGKKEGNTWEKSWLGEVCDLLGTALREGRSKRVSKWETECSGSTWEIKSIGKLLGKINYLQFSKREPYTTQCPRRAKCR